MKNYRIVLAILLGVILAIAAPFAIPRSVLAQAPVCYDENRREIPCPAEPEQPQPEQEEKKRPTSVPPTKTPIPTATVTATITNTFTPTATVANTTVPSLTPTATKVPFFELLPKAGGDGREIPPGIVWGSGLLFGLLGAFVLVLRLVFILKRAPIIDYNIPEEMDLLFGKQDQMGQAPFSNARGVDNTDILGMAFIVMMRAAKTAREDIKEIMAAMQKIMDQAKHALLKLANMDAILIGHVPTQINPVSRDKPSGDTSIARVGQREFYIDETGIIHPSSGDGSDDDD